MSFVVGFAVGFAVYHYRDTLRDWAWKAWQWGESKWDKDK